MGETDNTIVVFTTDNGAETFTWPDGGMTPFRYAKGTIFEGGFRVPCHRSLARAHQARHGREWDFFRPGLVPHFRRCGGQSGHKVDQLLKGVKLGDRTYKNHLDGYNQMDLLEGKGPSARHEIFYFGGAELGAVRVDNFKYQFYDQPDGMARSQGRDRYAQDLQHPARSVRANTDLELW